MVRYFRIPTANSGVFSIASDRVMRRVWFTEDMAGKLGYVTPGGKIVEVALPKRNALPWGIVVDAKGGVWFAEHNLDAIGRYTPIN
jgi:virginiamycin B lyase